MLNQAKCVLPAVFGHEKAWQASIRQNKSQK